MGTHCPTRMLVASSQLRQKIGALAALVVLTASGCVHTQVVRLGRMELGNGHEGYAPVLAEADASFERVAAITVDASAVKTETRRLRHLQRRASLLGCDGIIGVNHLDSDRSQAICVRRREIQRPTVVATTRVARPSSSLRERARSAGDTGIALLRVLDQAEGKQGDEAAWPLKWYLSKYPNSPFRADVEALFVASTSTGGTPSTIRTAPQGQ